MMMRKKIFHIVILFIIIIIGAVFLWYKYVLYNYTSIRNIKAAEYEISSRNTHYVLEIKNINLPLDYNNVTNKFKKPYIILSKGQKRYDKPYIIYLSGGPLAVNDFLSFRHSKIYKDTILRHVEWTYKDLLDDFNILYIDDRLNDVLDLLECSSPSIAWDSYLSKNYQVEWRCNQDLKNIKTILSDNSDVQDIKSILDAENIRRAHFIGVSFGGNRTVSFIEKYPQFVASFSSFHGAIFSIKDLKTIDEAKQYIFDNMDEVYTNSVYRWPFSKKPSIIANEFDDYLKRNLSDKDYFLVVGANSNYSELGYIPLEENFDRLIGKRVELFLPNESQNITMSNEDNLRDLRLCDTYVKDYIVSAIYSPVNEYIYKICGTYPHKDKPNKSFIIPDYIPVQVISAGLDRRVISNDFKDMIFASHNMGIANYRDAQHGDCQKEGFRDIILPFLKTLKPQNTSLICFETPFYDAIALSDDDLFDAKQAPIIRRGFFWNFWNDVFF